MSIVIWASISRTPLKGALCVALLILLGASLYAYSVSYGSVPAIPLYPGSQVIERHLHNASAETILTARVVMKATGDTTATNKQYVRLLTDAGWHSGFLACRHWPFSKEVPPLPWHHSGPFPWDPEWTATMEYNDMGNTITYIVVNVWSDYTAPEDCVYKRE